jgi:hypothetical protein
MIKLQLINADTVTSWLFRKSFNCRYNPRMDYAFCLLTLKEFFFCNYRSGLPLSSHRPVITKNTGKYDSIGDKKRKKNMCTNIVNYITFGSDTSYSNLQRSSPHIYIRFPPTNMTILYCYLKI